MKKRRSHLITKDSFSRKEIISHDNVTSYFVRCIECTSGNQQIFTLVFLWWYSCKRGSPTFMKKNVIINSRPTFRTLSVQQLKIIKSYITSAFKILGLLEKFPWLFDSNAFSATECLLIQAKIRAYIFWRTNAVIWSSICFITDAVKTTPLRRLQYVESQLKRRQPPPPSENAHFHNKRSFYDFFAIRKNRHVLPPQELFQNTSNVPEPSSRHIISYILEDKRS